MSYTFTAPDPHSKEDVDFDFFDDPGDRDSPVHMGQSGKWKQEASDSENIDKNIRNKKDSARSTNSSRKSSARSDSQFDSYSSDYTDSEDETARSNRKDVKKIEAKIPTAESKKSGSDERGRDHQISSSPREGRRRDTRPKTSKRRGSSYSSDSCHSKDSLSDSDYTTDTDSDVTDVSPLNTPHTPITSDIKQQSERRNHSGKPPKSPGQKEVTFCRPVSATSSNSTYRALTRADDDNIDLKLLMQAVMEMEKGHVIPQQSQTHHSTFTIPPHNLPKKNMSFSNDSVRTIDLENQRLMRRILHFNQEAKQRKKAIKSANKKTIPGSSRISTSAINRRNEQKRIERENFTMLQRLQNARPTQNLAKDHLMHDYSNQFIHGCSVAAAHPTTCTPKKHTIRSPSPYVVPFDPKFSPTKSHSMTNLKSDSTSDVSGYSAHENTKKARPVSATVRGSRPQSAKNAARKRPQSAKVQGSVPTVKPVGRPAWDDRW